MVEKKWTRDVMSGGRCSQISSDISGPVDQKRVNTKINIITELHRWAQRPRIDSYTESEST